jgi:hypothetical protein
LLWACETLGCPEPYGLEVVVKLGDIVRVDGYQKYPVLQCSGTEPLTYVIRQRQRRREQHRWWDRDGGYRGVSVIDNNNFSIAPQPPFP